MVRLIALVAALALSACSESPQASAPQTAESGQLPFDNATGLPDGYSLRVPREGHLIWNGHPVSEAELKDYLRQWSARPRGAGSLFVAFEPGIAQARAEWVRREVIASGLCRQERCFEVAWDAKRPVVN